MEEHIYGGDIYTENKYIKKIYEQRGMQNIYKRDIHIYQIIIPIDIGITILMIL